MSYRIGDERRTRELLMKLNQLRVEADMENRKRNERFQQILQELMAATLSEEQPGQSSK